MKSFALTLPAAVHAIGRHLASACASLGLLFTASVQAADLSVRISGIQPPLGQIGCSLFAQPAGFPMDNSAARNQWVAADTGGVTCSFADVPAGRYAVAIGHDANANRRVDTNFLGIPKEQWGVSNNVRPRLRAPSFDEAAFQFAADGADRVVEINVAK